MPGTVTSGTVATGAIPGSRKVYVPGVLVSGTVPLDSSAPQILRVNGAKGAHGDLTVTPARITGRLGGRRIDLVARSAGVTAFDDPPYDALVRRFRLRHAG